MELIYIQKNKKKQMINKKLKSQNNQSMLKQNLHTDKNTDLLTLNLKNNLLLQKDY